jgi:hypothetical protein
MEALHLRRYADEGARQAAVAAQDAAAAAAAASAERAAFRDGLRGRLCANRTDRAAKLQRDEAVHAAILRHQVGCHSPPRRGAALSCGPAQHARCTCTPLLMLTRAMLGRFLAAG